MRRWTDNDASEAANRQDKASQMQKRLAKINKLLETENLRALPDDTLYELETELNELIIEVRNNPEGASTTPMILKKSLLHNLRSASIKLNQAWDQIEFRGKTSRYYQYLLACKGYLEKADEQYVKVMIESKNDPSQSYTTAARQKSGLHISLVTLRVRGQEYLRELSNGQELLQQTYNLFDREDELWPEQCTQATSNIHTMNQYIQNTIKLLNSSPELPPSISSSSYELAAKLYHLDEQAHILASLIASLQMLCQTKSKRISKLREEILCKLETFEQSYQNIQQSMALFLKQVNSSESQHSNIIVLYS